MAHYSNDWYQNSHQEHLHILAEHILMEIPYTQTCIKANHYQQILSKRKRGTRIAKIGRIVFNTLIVCLIGPIILYVIAALSPALIAFGIIALLHAWSKYDDEFERGESLTYGLILLVVGILTLPICIWITQNQ